jgi:flavin-dependent dehydrogenase
MMHRQLAGVVWHRQGQFIDLIYADAEADHLIGSEGVAAGLAREAGLARVPTPDDRACWVVQVRNRQVESVG